jgi:hypothetical protein
MPGRQPSNRAGKAGRLFVPQWFWTASGWVGIRPTGRDSRPNLEVRRGCLGIDLAGHRVPHRPPSALDDRFDPGGHWSDPLPARRYRPRGRWSAILVLTWRGRRDVWLAAPALRRRRPGRHKRFGRSYSDRARAVRTGRVAVSASLRPIFELLVERLFESLLRMRDSGRF